jgi:restriction endonuclease S subunit
LSTEFTFITNEPEKNMKERFDVLIKDAGFFDYEIETETARPEFSLKNLHIFKIPLPILVEQDVFKDNLETLSETASAKGDHLEKLYLLKQELMEDPLSGRVWVGNTL